MPAGSQGFGQSNPAGTLSEPSLVCDYLARVVENYVAIVLEVFVQTHSGRI